MSRDLNTVLDDLKPKSPEMGSIFIRSNGSGVKVLYNLLMNEYKKTIKIPSDTFMV